MKYGGKKEQDDSIMTGTQLVHVRSFRAGHGHGSVVPPEASGRSEEGGAVSGRVAN